MRLSINRIYQTRGAYIALSLVGLYAHMRWAQDLYEWYDRLLAWLLLSIFLVVVNQFVRQSGVRVPLVPLISLQFYILYGFAQFSQTSLSLIYGLYFPAGWAVSGAMLLAVGAELTFLVGARLGAHMATASRASVWAIFPEPSKRWVGLGLIYSAVSALLRLVTVLSPERIPLDVRNVILVVLNHNLGLILLLFFGYRFGWKQLRLPAVAMLTTLLVTGVMSGMLENIIVPLYLWFAAAWMWGPGVRLRWVALAIAVYFVLSPAKHLYRNANIEGNLAGNTWDAAISMKTWAEAVQSTWSDPAGWEEAFKPGLARASGIIALAQGVEWIPDIVPFNRGSGFSTSLVYFIPRLVWSDKPGISDLINNRYAIEFGISTLEGIERSTFGIVQPLDGYWDFGVVGGLFYPSVLGMMLGWLFFGGRQRGAAMSILGLLFSAVFFQTLASLQYLLASIVSMSCGALIAMSAINGLARRRIE